MEPHQPAQLAPTGVVAGLSIDDGLLRVVVVERDAPPTVVDDAEADLAPDVVVRGVVRDVAALARRIGQLWQALGLGGVPTYVGLHPHDAELRTVRVRSWPDVGWPPEVARVVDGLHRRYGEAVVWHAAPLWRDQAVAARVAATRRSAVAAAATAARQGGLWVAGVELSGMAMERALERIAPPFTLVVDRTGRGPATLLLLDHGDAVLGWRSALPDDAVGGGELRVYLLDEPTAMAMARGTVRAGEWLLSPPLLSDRRAALLRPGAGLAQGSPAPPAAFAVPVGLALGAAGVDPRPLELQGPLLAADEGARRGAGPRPPMASTVSPALVAEALAIERGDHAGPEQTPAAIIEASDGSVPDDRGDEDPGPPSGGSPVEPVEPDAPAAPGGVPVGSDDGAAFAEALRAAWGAHPPVRRMPPPPPPPAGRGSDGAADAALPAEAAPCGTATARPALVQEGGSGRMLWEPPVGPMSMLVPLPVTPTVADPPTEVGEVPDADPEIDDAAEPPSGQREAAGSRSGAATDRSRCPTRRTLLLAAALGTGAFLVARAVGGEPDLTPGTTEDDPIEADPIEGERPGREPQPGMAG